MAGEWPTMTLREANVGLIDCDHRTPPAADRGYPYVAIPQLRAGRIDLSDVRRITREHYMEWTRKAKPSANDVILSRRCNPGETAVAPPDLEFALGQNLVLLRADGTKIHPPCLRWLVRGPEWWEQINKFINVGAVFDSLKCADIPNFQLGIPPLPEQRAIAHILGTLDDKIELNRWMNETLEAMVRALFKSWFVDFDPIRAKANLPSPSGRGAGGEGRVGGEGYHCSSHAYPPTELRDFARTLRNNQTDAEHLMWRMLRDRRIAGAKFRRQHPVPPYVLDFYCHELRLAIELDGGQHGEATGRERDRQRDAALSERGITVLRFWNNEVLNETEAVLEQIYWTVTECVSPSPGPSGHPLPGGEGLCGLPKGIADLFPDSFEDSELGEIPKRWEVKTVGDLAEVVGGSTPSTKEHAYWDEGAHHWATPKDLSTLAAPVLLDTERRITDAGLAQISSGLLPVGTVLLSSRAPIGYLVIAEVPVAINQGFIAMKPRKGVSNLFLLLWSDFAHDDILSRANGSTFLEISKANFRPILSVAPPAQIMEVFDQHVRPLYQHIVSNERESRTLAALRDALLPKLISGELRVKDADKILEETL